MMVQDIGFLLIGLLAGVLSGLLGIGGAVFIVPVLVHVFGWEQHIAQGTTLAMLIPPVGILAAWQYYSAGHVNVKVAVIMCIGLFVGGFIGGKFANAISSDILHKVFGAALLLISLEMIFGK